LSCCAARRTPLITYELPAGNAAEPPAWDATGIPLPYHFPPARFKRFLGIFFQLLPSGTTHHACQRPASRNDRQRLGAELPSHWSACRRRSPSSASGSWEVNRDGPPARSPGTGSALSWSPRSRGATRCQGLAHHAGRTEQLHRRHRAPARIHEPRSGPGPERAPPSAGWPGPLRENGLIAKRC
jgi:hypothetical protein